MDMNPVEKEITPTNDRKPDEAVANAVLAENTQARPPSDGKEEERLVTNSSSTSEGQDLLKVICGLILCLTFILLFAYGISTRSTGISDVALANSQFSRSIQNYRDQVTNLAKHMGQQFHDLRHRIRFSIMDKIHKPKGETGAVNNDVLPDLDAILKEEGKNGQLLLTELKQEELQRELQIQKIADSINKTVHDLYAQLNHLIEINRGFDEVSDTQKAQPKFVTVEDL